MMAARKEQDARFRAGVERIYAAQARKSLVVVLAQADVGEWTRRMAHLGKEMDGALALEHMRGFQAGYEQCMRDSKQARAELAFSPDRARHGGRRGRRT
jgi:hypothetical protein